MVVPAIVALLVYRWFNRRLIRLAGRYSPFLQKAIGPRSGPGQRDHRDRRRGHRAGRRRFPVLRDGCDRPRAARGVCPTLGWAAAIALDLGVEIYLRRYSTDVADNLLARKHVTQMRILQRVAKTLLVILTAAAA